MYEIFSGRQPHQDVKENLDVLMQMSAQENFIVFHCCESFKKYQLEWSYLLQLSTRWQ